ncbi:hypothetical protein SmJEL517_g02806 [Synchytrium microbalum]|uniref:Uncharacterized protein n=1 Tax=Synchytrium microbalum TaxID=1806994 RepID=A0A507CAC7_9FUNG|nr:uncharacterized protein SmJEL517_g02806 [Synchytrium microbalum]TPX34493.1 hypothetical protein SmJEL517_g02806 [Synchytrium microbalum]
MLKASSYTATQLRSAGDKLLNIINGTGFNTTKLSKPAQLNLELLSSLANSLSLTEVQVGSYETALLNLMMEEESIQESISRLSHLRSDLEKNLKNLDADLDYLTRHARAHAHSNFETKQSSSNGLTRWTSSHQSKRDTEQQTASTWEHNVLLLHQKSEEYTERLEELQRDWTEEEESVRVPVVQDLERELDAIQRAYESDLRLLKSYQDLPPDITLAKIKLGEREKQLESLIGDKTTLLNRAFA